MDIDTIRDEVAERTEMILEDALETVEDNFDFMEDNSLIEPKKDYLSLWDFLNKTTNHFSNLDYQFHDETLRKLHRDVSNLHRLYQPQKDSLDAMESIFTTQVLSKIGLFKPMQKSFIELQRSPDMKDDDPEVRNMAKEDLEYVKSQYNEMKTIYLGIFKEEYLESSNYIVSSLETILNSKIYYLDKLIWINASQSPAILRAIRLFDKKKNNYNSKMYLEARISVALPYTADYEYLQKCLRIYR